MKKSSVGKAITACVLFLGIFSLLARWGVYAAAVLAIFVTYRVTSNLN